MSYNGGVRYNPFTTIIPGRFTNGIWRTEKY